MSFSLEENEPCWEGETQLEIKIGNFFRIIHSFIHSTYICWACIIICQFLLHNRNRSKSRLCYEGSFHTQYQLMVQLTSVIFPTGFYGMCFSLKSCLKKFCWLEFDFFFLSSKTYNKLKLNKQTKPLLAGYPNFHEYQHTQKYAFKKGTKIWIH